LSNEGDGVSSAFLGGKNMEQVMKSEIEAIKGKIQCQKNFRCFDSGFEVLCEARDIGIGTMLECLDEDPEQCKNSFAFYGFSYLCECPIRVYICKKLKK